MVLYKENSRFLIATECAVEGLRLQWFLKYALRKYVGRKRTLVPWIFTMIYIYPRSCASGKMETSLFAHPFRTLSRNVYAANSLYTFLYCAIILSHKAGTLISYAVYFFWTTSRHSCDLTVQLIVQMIVINVMCMKHQHINN